MDLDKEQNRPKAPTGAGEVPVPQEEPQKVGKPLETPRPAKDEEAPTVSSQRSSVRDTYLCLPTKRGTLLCSIVSGIFVFSGLLAFSFADLGISSSEKLSSSLFWRCIGVVVFFYIPIMVVATPMERNLVFLAAVESVHKVNDVMIFEELSSQTQHEKNMKRHVHSQNPFQKEIWAFHVSYLHVWLIGFQRDL